MRNLAILAAVAALSIPAAANAQAVIANGPGGAAGNVMLGINQTGELNYRGDLTNVSATGQRIVGLRSTSTRNEATSDGCTCEGWGAAVQGTGTTVYRNTAVGSSGVGSSSMVTDYAGVGTIGTFAISTVTSSTGALKVVHNYHASATPFLYQVDVTITNSSGADFTGKTLYRRTMDWDIEPTPFSEFSTIQGAVAATNVLSSSDNGFCNSNPLLVACGGTPGDFLHLGPFDHGAQFTFIFDLLKAGESRTFQTFYGVAPTETGALAALGVVGAEVYSFGQSRAGPADFKLKETFIFAFKGVGGTVIHGVPEPTSWALMIMGAGFVGTTLRTSRRRRIALAA